IESDVYLGKLHKTRDRRHPPPSKLGGDSMVGGKVVFTPFEVFEHLRETLAAYLETAYKISDRPAFAERAVYLREGGLTPTVAQVPYIESTPAFPPGPALDALIPELRGVPAQLSDLAAFGM